MYINNIKGDIYVGKGCGTKLLKDIDGAEKSIKIVSPYLSSSLVDKLILANEKGIDVSLITSDDIERKGVMGKTIYKLIKQNRFLDKDAYDKRNYLKKISTVVLSLIFFTCLIAIIRYVLTQGLTQGLA